MCTKTGGRRKGGEDSWRRLPVTVRRAACERDTAPPARVAMRRRPAPVRVLGHALQNPGNVVAPQIAQDTPMVKRAIDATEKLFLLLIALACGIISRMRKDD